MNTRALGYHRRRKPALARGQRLGFTLIESIVSATLLLTVISFFTAIVYRVDRVWRDTAHRRAAMMELSNQLEELTLLTPSQARQRLDSLQPSDSVASLLTNSVLAAEIVEDEWGGRVVLELNWKRQHPGTPVRLVGWLRPLETTSAADSAADNTADNTSEADGNADGQEPTL